MVAYLHLIGQVTHAWPRDVSPRAPLLEQNFEVILWSIALLSSSQNMQIFN